MPVIDRELKEKQSEEKCSPKLSKRGSEHRRYEDEDQERLLEKPESTEEKGGATYLNNTI